MAGHSDSLGEVLFVWHDGPVTSPDPTATSGLPHDLGEGTVSTRRELRETASGRGRGGSSGSGRPVKSRMRGRLAAGLAVTGLVAGIASGAAVSALTPPTSPGTGIAASDAVTGVSQPVEARKDESDRASRADDRDLVEAVEAPAAPDEVVATLTGLVEQVRPEGIDDVDFAAGLLSQTVPDAAAGTFDVVPGEIPAPGVGEVVSVRIEVEHGLDIDGAKFADTVLTTLNDPRSWGGDGSRTFSRTAGEASLTVTLASPATVDRLCAPLDTGGLWSCGVQGRAVLNHLRWVTGSAVYGDDMAAYREYLVNHEVGHVLGHRHRSCTSSSAPAPVMVQQSGALIACVPNGWPFP